MKAAIASLGVVAAAAAIAACTRAEQAVPKDAIAALETAFNRSDIAGCVAQYTEDAEIIAEDAPAVRGRQAIQEFFQGQIAREIQFDTDTSVNIASGDLGIEQGTYRVRNVEIGKDVEYGEYLHVWRRTPDGDWRIFRTMFNVTQSPQGGVSVAPDI